MTEKLTVDTQPKTLTDDQHARLLDFALKDFAWGIHSRGDDFEDWYHELQGISKADALAWVDRMRAKVNAGNEGRPND
jgi:hypothetical protein